MVWGLSGPTGLTERGESAMNLLSAHTLMVEGITNKEIVSSLRSSWELEYLRIERVVSDPVCDQFASALHVNNGRYEVSLFQRITITLQITTL